MAGVAVLAINTFYEESEEYQKMMVACKNCGTRLPGMAQYCPNCGIKMNSPITPGYVEEDERDFAFHSEYYRPIGVGNYPGQPRMEHFCGCTWYDGALYDLYEENDQNYILKVAEDGSILDIIALGEGNFYNIRSNRHGIFFVYGWGVLVYDFQGNKKHEIVFEETFGEQYEVSDKYIFGSKLYVALYKKVSSSAVSELGVCVKAYDFLADRLEMVWSLDQEAEELQDFAKCQLRGQMEKYGGGKNLQHSENPEWEIIGEPTICANSQYAVISYGLVTRPADEEGYELSIQPILLLDIKIGCCEYIKDVYGGCGGINTIRLDLRQNRMWLPGEIAGSPDTLLGFPIQNLSEIDLNRYEDIWQCDTNMNWNQCYFDGEHAYWADGSYCFYAYQKDGRPAGEWNRSGHGETKCVVYGPYVLAVLDERWGIFRHSIEPPEEKCFDWDRNVVKEKIRERETRQNHGTVEKPPKKPESAFDSMSILQLRALFQNSSEYSQQLKTFRKGLKDDKWDFNVVMGILLGSRKRHATGPRHIQEQNAGIGQGDNKDMVVFTLTQYGMTDIYEKYENISDPDILVAQAIQDICERTPKLTKICDEIRTILQ